MSPYVNLFNDPGGYGVYQTLVRPFTNQYQINANQSNSINQLQQQLNQVRSGSGLGNTPHSPDRSCGDLYGSVALLHGRPRPLIRIILGSRNPAQSVNGKLDAKASASDGAALACAADDHWPTNIRASRKTSCEPHNAPGRIRTAVILPAPVALGPKSPGLRFDIRSFST